MIKDAFNHRLISTFLRLCKNLRPNFDERNWVGCHFTVLANATIATIRVNKSIFCHRLLCFSPGRKQHRDTWPGHVHDGKPPPLVSFTRDCLPTITRGGETSIYVCFSHVIHLFSTVKCFQATATVFLFFFLIKFKLLNNIWRNLLQRRRLCQKTIFIIAWDFLLSAGISLFT